MAKSYNIGVIGYGLSAKVFHIPLILVTPNLVLHSIVQRSPKPADSAKNDHPSVKIYQSAEELIKDEEVDIVVVTTTPETHFSFTKTSLESGKHVIVEKPFVPTAAEAGELVEISERTGKFICVYQNRRWDSDFLTFQKLQRDGILGRIYEFETHFDRYKAERPTTWKGSLGMNDAGGVVYDLGTHLIDQAVVAFGMPTSVIGYLTNQRGDYETAEPDSVTALLQYHAGEHRGLLVTVKAGVMSVEQNQLRYWVRGTKGTYKKLHLDIQEDQLKAGMKPGDEGFGIEETRKAGTLVGFEDGKPIEKEMENVVPETYATLYKEFLRAIERNNSAQIPVKATEARDVLRVIEAIRRSAIENKTISL